MSTRGVGVSAMLALLAAPGLVGCGEIVTQVPSDGWANGIDGGAFPTLKSLPEALKSLPGSGEDPENSHDSEVLAAADPMVGTLHARVNDELVGLRLSDLAVDVQAAAEMAAVTVEHTFVNPHETQLEATFRFALPPGAIVTGMAMNIGDRMVEAEIVEKSKAERTFRSIVDAMRDPALLRWQGQGALELRVFPVEAKSPKRVVLRYLAPTLRVNGTNRLVLLAPKTTLAAAAPDVTVTVQGRTVAATPTMAAAVYIATVSQAQPLADAQGGEAVVGQWQQQDGAGASYVAVRFDPALALLQAMDTPPTASEPKKSERRATLLVIDRSRSALEAGEMQASIIAAVLADHAPADEVAVLAFDIECRQMDGDFLPVSEVSSERVQRWLDTREPDGASDVHGALRCAAAIADRRYDTILVSDGVATWGNIDLPALQEAAAAVGRHGKMHAFGLGRSVDRDALMALTQATGGLTVTPHLEADVTAGLERMRRLHETVALGGVVVSAGGLSVSPARLGTVLPGELETVVLQVPRGSNQPTSMSIQGQIGDRSVTAEVPLQADSKPAIGLNERFGYARVRLLEEWGAEPSAIVATSRKFGVLSRHTSLLVLESEEAYKQHGIERLRGPNAPVTVSGGDLESVEGGPSVSPNRIQPGDPEVWIPAPRDARAVYVTLPWGERMPARWVDKDDRGRSGWVARFLVALSIPEGDYPVAVEVIHADGRIEDIQLSIAVDTTAPTLRVTLRPHHRLRGVFVIKARQLDGQDARGVEVKLPDGQLVPLTALGRGRFVARWTPAAVITWPVRAEVFAIDRALNQVTQVVGFGSPHAEVRVGDGRRRPTGLPAGKLKAPKVGRDVTAVIALDKHVVVGTLQDGLWELRADFSESDNLGAKLPGSDNLGAKLPGSHELGAKHPGLRRRLCARQVVDHRINRLALSKQRRGGRLPPGIWIATANGLYFQPLHCTEENASMARLWGRDHGLPSANIHSVMATTDGVWVGTAEGAAVVRKGRRVKQLGRKQGVDARAIWDIAATSDGAVWLASSWGVYRYENDASVRLSVATGHLSDDWVTAVAADGDDVIVGTYKGGVTRLMRLPASDGSVKFDAVSYSVPTHVNLGGIAVGGQGVLVASMQGLFVLGHKGSSATNRLLAPKVENATAVSRSGGFVGTRDGLVHGAQISSLIGR